MKLEPLHNVKKPYICTPITGKTKDEIFEQLNLVIAHKPDLIEWRADFFSQIENTELVLQIVTEIKTITSIPLLFTIRSIHEGGEEISLSDAEKVDLLTNVCLKTAVEIIDFETSNEGRYVEQVVAAAKTNNKQLILSYHNFTLTPDNEKLISVAKQAEEFGADVAKIAVMPEAEADVLRLLEVTRAINDQLNIPIISMSMGAIGGLSRVIGWAYGSIVTFAVGADISAPGQMPVKKLRQAIQATQELTGEFRI